MRRFATGDVVQIPQYPCQLFMDCAAKVMSGDRSGLLTRSQRVRFLLSLPIQIVLRMSQLGWVESIISQGDPI